MPRTTSSVNRNKQTTVTTRAKRARIEEAGLGGRRVGEATATTQAAQARRDSQAKRATRAAAAKRAAAVQPAAGPEAKSAKKKTRYAKPRVKRSGPLIEVRTSNSVKGSAKLDAHVEGVVSAAFSRRFGDRLTRIDIHLSDDNAAKEGGNDKRCQIEARPASQQPVATSATAATVEKALLSALTKMKRLLASRLAPRVRGG